MTMPTDFIDLATVIDGLVVDMRYASAQNFIGDPIDGYEAPRALMTRKAAFALADVQRDLARDGLGLKIFDAYRPRRAVRHFMRWAEDAGDLRMKADYYPDLDKPDLFRLGFIAADSAHCRGSTVDLTLVRRVDGIELPMGSAFDFFGPPSNIDYAGLSATERANRATLQEAMAARGFVGFAQEWWHFTLRDEPFPETRFDFPISRDAIAG